ncbi:MAG: 50S ribosomal protein L10 [Candidatus Omnitrophota bacterium]
MSQKYGKKVREKMVAEMKDILSGSEGFVLSSVENMKASDMDVLRKTIRKSGSRYLVLKNRLAKVALKESGMEGFEDLVGEKKILGIGVIKDDPVKVAKILKEFAKQNKGFNISRGYIGGSMVTAERVNDLADLPGREQLLAMVLSTVNAPVTGFVNVLSGVMRGLLYAINAVKEKKGSE